MKFKDLKVGQWFRVKTGSATQEKINPHPGNYGRTICTHKEVVPPTDIRGGFIKDDWDVVPVDDNTPQRRL